MTGLGDVDNAAAVLSLTVISTLRYQQERSVTDRGLCGVPVIPVSVRTGGSMDLR
jgi:hypothetical protein